MNAIKAAIAILLLTAPAALGAGQTAPKPAPVQPAPQQPAEAKPAPYDQQLTRLAEVMGSITYLRGLCGAASDNWRSDMRRLMDSDTANEPARRQKLTAAFNRGYRSFAALHTSCTEAARDAELRYRNEGATLAAEIAGRFGN